MTRTRQVLGLTSLAAGLVVLPLVVACGSEGEAPPASHAPGAPPARAHYHYGGGGGGGGGGSGGGGGGYGGYGGGGGGRARGGGGGGGGGAPTTTGGAIGETYRRRHAARERWLAGEREKMGPVRLSDDYHSEHPEYAVIEPMIAAGLAAREPGDDDCEQQWAFQETLLEESGAPHGSDVEAQFMLQCRATPDEMRRCGEASYHDTHVEECNRIAERAERRGRAMARADGSADARLDTLRSGLRDARGRAGAAGRSVPRLSGEEDDAPPPTGSSGTLGEPASLADESVAPEPGSTEPLAAPAVRGRR